MRLALGFIICRIILCPLLYAPKYCDNRLPPSDNKLKDVLEVNRWIHKFNKDNTGKSIFKYD